MRAGQARGITILRDKTGLGLGESITRFMQKLGAGDRVFVILSEKYLKSAILYVRADGGLAELQDGGRGVSPAHPGLPTAGCRDDDPDRARGYAKYWKEQFTELDAAVREDPTCWARPTSSATS